MNGIGLNILSQYVRDQNALMDWITRAQPAAVVVMDSPALAQTIRQRSPQTFVIHRTFNENDTRWHEVTSPTQWLLSHGGIAANGVALQVYNEPKPGDLGKFFSWLEELIRLCPAHITLAIYAPGVGNPHEKDITSGVYDRTLRMVSGTRHWLMLHEYFQQSPMIEYPWLCGRFEFWLERADALNIQHPKIVIGEYGRDLGGGENDGWHGQGWSDRQYFDKLTQGTDILYRPYDIPTCVFCWGYGAGDDWLSFDIQDATELQNLIVQYGKDFPMNPVAEVVLIPAPTTGGKRHQLTQIPELARGHINIRTQPGVITPESDLGDLLVGDIGLYFPDYTPTGAGDWRYFIADKGVEGWVSQQNGTVKFTLLAPPATVTLTVAQYNQLVSLANQMIVVLEQVALPTPELPF